MSTSVVLCVQDELMKIPVNELMCNQYMRYNGLNGNI
jgi:hypothetical protein